MKKTIIIGLMLFLAAAIFIFVIASNLLRVDCANAQDCPLTDDQYIQLAKNTPEVKELIKKYPDLDITVDRSGRLAVDFRKDKQNAYLRLRIFINPKTNQTEGKFIECYNNTQSQRTEQGITNYIRNENCLID